MKRQRLVVISDYQTPPGEPNIEEAFGSRAEYDAWMNSPLSPETDSSLASDLLSGVEKTTLSRGLRMMMVLMERPFFALTNQRTKPISYRSPDGSITVDVELGPDGMATIYDADVLMFLIDTLATMPANAGRTVVMKGSDYFRAVGSKAGGGQYKLLEGALNRLRTTRVTTNAQPDGKPGAAVTFTWIERAEHRGRGWEIAVPAWLAEGARSSAILNISPSYFALRGLSRSLYLIARKHVGSQDILFQIRSSTLWAKLGSGDDLAHFRHKLKGLVKGNQIPGYLLIYEDGPDGKLTISRRSIY